MGRSVTPAMGAKKTGVSREKEPSCMRAALTIGKCPSVKKLGSVLKSGVWVVLGACRMTVDPSSH